MTLFIILIRKFIHIYIFQVIWLLKPTKKLVYWTKIIFCFLFYLDILLPEEAWIGETSQILNSLISQINRI